MENCPEYFPLLYGIWRAGLVRRAAQQQAAPQGDGLDTGQLRSTKLCIASPKLAGSLSAPGLGALPPIVATGIDRSSRAARVAMPSPMACQRRQRRSLAVLHQRHHRPAQGRDAQPPQPAVRLPLLLRRHRFHRHARHHPARRAADARLRPLRPRPHRPRRQQRHPGRLVRARAGVRRAGDNRKRQHVRCAHHGVAPHQSPRRRLCRHARPQDHHLRRRPDVPRRSGARARRCWAPSSTISTARARAP